MAECVYAYAYMLPVRLRFGGRPQTAPETQREGQGKAGAAAAAQAIGGQSSQGARVEAGKRLLLIKE